MNFLLLYLLFLLLVYGIITVDIHPFEIMEAKNDSIAMDWRVYRSKGHFFIASVMLNTL